MIFEKSVSDEKIVENCKSGDRSAFNELIDRYKKMAFSMAYNMTGSIESAEDISQEAFVVVYTKIQKFREECSFKTWFYKIVLNLCRRYHRKNNIISVVSFGLMNREGLETSYESRTESTPEVQLHSRQIGRRVFSALKKLPPRQREIFSMKHLKGMKINEIAHIIGCSEGTIKSHLFRAIKKLQKDLGGL